MTLLNVADEAKAFQEMLDNAARAEGLTIDEFGAASLEAQQRMAAALKKDDGTPLLNCVTVSAVATMLHAVAGHLASIASPQFLPMLGAYMFEAVMHAQQEQATKPN